MKEKLTIFLKFALIIALMLSPAFAGKLMAQTTPPPDAPVIELTTSWPGAAVYMQMQAAAADTPVWIETEPGTYEQVTVGTNWGDFEGNTYTGTSLNVYGNITGFNCSENGFLSALDASGNNGLQILYCNSNWQLSSLNVSHLLSLQHLHCFRNPQLTSLNVSHLLSLQHLACSDNQQLTSLNVTDLPSLQHLACSDNQQLTSLNVTDLPSLQHLHCNYNPQLTSLTLTDLPELQELYCNNNGLSSLTLTNLPKLQNLYCNNNGLSSLTLTNLPKLQHLDCNNNQFGTLGLDQIYCKLPPRNPNDIAKIYVSSQAQTQLEDFISATNVRNANDNYWEVWSSAGYEITNTIATGSYVCGSVPLLGSPVIELTTSSPGAEVRISMQAAQNGTPVWIETEPGTYEQVTVGTNWTIRTSYTPTGTSLKVYGDITGFDCSENGSLSALDASGNKGLQYLDCFDNQLTSLNVTGLTALKELDCFYNQLTSLNVTGLTALQNLDCSINQLTSLNVTGLTALQRLDCSYNQLTSLNVTGLTALQRLDCHENKLTSLDVIGLTALQNLYCHKNKLTSLNVSGLTALQNLDCSINQLTSLDLTGLNALEILACNNNQFGTLALDQIYCQLPNWRGDIVVSSKDQANLEGFIRATNVKNANANYWKVWSKNDSDIYEITNTIATGSYVCGSVPLLGSPVIELTTSSPGAEVRISMQAAQNGTPVWIETAPNTFTQVTVGTDWTVFTNYTTTDRSLKIHGDITKFDCSGESSTNRNPVAVVNASGNTGLQELRCSNNQFGTLGLDQIYCHLPDRTGAIAGEIYVSSQAQSGLEPFVLASATNNANSNNWNVHTTNNNYEIKNTSVARQCGDVPPVGAPVIELTTSSPGAGVEIRMKAAENQTPVWIETAQNTYIQVQVGTSLTSWTSYTPTGTSLKVHGAITGFDCSWNESLSALDASGNKGLQVLDCFNNQLTSLNVTGLTALQELYCFDNQLTSLNVTGLTSLQNLSCDNNQLTSLNVTGLTSLQNLGCSYNQLTSLDLTGLNALKQLFCYNNQFGTLALDQIYCQLPDRTGVTEGKIIVSDQDLTNIETLVTDSSGDIATEKNWYIYNSSYSRISTEGTRQCGDFPPVGAPVIELTTSSPGAYVDITMRAAAANTPVWIETEPDSYQKEELHANFPSSYNIVVGDTKLKVYGNIIMFDCSENSSLSALDASGNKGLQILDCTYNQQLTSLNVRDLPALKILYCNDNQQLTSLTLTDLPKLQILDCSYNQQLSSLTLTNLPKLQNLYCNNNQLTSLNVTGLTALKELKCGENQLTSLDLTGLSSLLILDCSNNQLTSLDLTGLNNLYFLYCSDNEFSTFALNQIYCQLPERDCVKTNQQF